MCFNGFLNLFNWWFIENYFHFFLKGWLRRWRSFFEVVFVNVVICCVWLKFRFVYLSLMIGWLYVLKGSCGTHWFIKRQTVLLCHRFSTHHHHRLVLLLMRRHSHFICLKLHKLFLWRIEQRFRLPHPNLINLRFELLQFTGHLLIE